MTDRLHCPLFHDTDGHCCADIEPCVFTQTRHIDLAAQDARLRREIYDQTRYALWLAIGAIVALFLGFGAVALERQDRAIKADMQEQVSP